MEELKNILLTEFDHEQGIYKHSTQEGYWSNLSVKDQKILFENLKTKTTKEAILDLFPQFFDMIFDQSRAVGLRLLEIENNDIGIDYGCMWGNLLISAARQCKAMVGVDQTSDSLRFTQLRLQEEGLDNCFLLNANLRSELSFKETFNFAILCGVLEWIPENRIIDLKRHFAKSRMKFMTPEINPRTDQLNFLKSVNRNLKTDGRIYLAIENRFDYRYFLGKKDPHSNQFFTAILPRFLSNILSNIKYGRPYVNYIYSFRALEDLLRDAGFERCEVYASFPDYHFPKKIFPIGLGVKFDSYLGYHLVETNDLYHHYALKIRRIADKVIFNKLKLLILAPAIIIIAYKK